MNSIPSVIALFIASPFRIRAKDMPERHHNDPAGAHAAGENGELGMQG